MKKPNRLTDGQILFLIDIVYQGVGIYRVTPVDRAIAQKALDECWKDALEQFIKWGDEDCPHNLTVRLKVKRGCIVCWQSLQAQLEETQK